MDLGHLLTMFFCDGLVEHLPRILLRLRLLIFVIVEVGRARMQIDVRELI